MLTFLAVLFHIRMRQAYADMKDVSYNIVAKQIPYTCHLSVLINVRDLPNI